MSGGCVVAPLFTGRTLTSVRSDALNAPRCGRCLAGTEPCPLFVHDEAAFDPHGFLQAALPGDEQAVQPYTGVMPLHAESPNLRRALAESTMRLLYPYPCWPLCDTLQIIEEPLTEGQVAFFRSYLHRLRKAYLATDPVTDAALAADEALVAAARSRGLNGRQAVAQLSGHWLSRLPLAVVLSNVWVPGAAVLCVDFALAQSGRCHAIQLGDAAAAGLAAAVQAAGWQLHQWSPVGATPDDVDKLLQACGLLETI